MLVKHNGVAVAEKVHSRTKWSQNLLLLQVWLEAVALTCSVKKVFLEIWQNSQENTYDRDSFLIKLQVSGLQLY